MNDYIKYMFDQYVLKSSSKQFNTLIKPQLLELKQVDFTKMYKQLTTSPVLFNQLNLLMAKGVIKYSPANCTVELSLPNVMVYQRLQKLINFSYKSLHPHVAEFINQWIGQGLQNGIGYPVMFEKSLISKVFVNSQPVEISAINLDEQKKKAKSNKQKSSLQQQQKSSLQQQQKSNTFQSYNYHRLVYEYKSSDNNSKSLELRQHNGNEKLDEQGQQIYFNKNQQQVNAKASKQQQGNKKSKPTSKNKDSKKSQKQQTKQIKTNTNTKQKQSHTQNKQQPQPKQYDQYMVNLQQLTRLFQSQKALDLINSRLTQKQKKQSLFQFLNHKDRQTIIQQLRWQKQQQFLAQILGQNCLLVFNLIKKYPYLTEKELIKMTLMEVLETRQALNQLLERGFVYFYYENTRTIVYKICDSAIMYKKLVDSVAKAIVNLSLAAQRISETSTYTNHGIEQVKDKLIKLECEIQRLDDVLLLFGY